MTPLYVSIVNHFFFSQGSAAPAHADPVQQLGLDQPPATHAAQQQGWPHTPGPSLAHAGQCSGGVVIYYY